MRLVSLVVLYVACMCVVLGCFDGALIWLFGAQGIPPRSSDFAPYAAMWLAGVVASCTLASVADG